MKGIGLGGHKDPDAVAGATPLGKPRFGELWQVVTS